MIYQSEYCSCLVDVKKDKLIKKCPIHKNAYDVFRHNVEINTSRGNKSRIEMRNKYHNKELPKGLKIAVKKVGNRIIDKLRRAIHL